VEPVAVLGTKVEGNGLRQAAPAAWVGDSSLRRIAVRLPERPNGVEAEELEAPIGDLR